MSKLTTAQRKALAVADFGDPTRRLFPIVDQADVDSAAHLIGKAKDPAAVKARIIAIAKRKGLSLPAAWEARASMTAEFRMVSQDGTTVLRRGKLWQAGDYPDKDFEMSPEENWAAVEAFAAPVPVDLEHTPTILDGHLGELRSVELSEDGTEIEGVVAMPLWLDQVIGDEPVRVSCTWDRDTKTLSRLALVQHPRVSDAAVMTAFAAFAAGGSPGAPRHDTPSGQGFHQMVHDMAAGAGARCSRANSARMHSGHELEGIQQVHDTAVEHGAMCARVGGGSARYSAETGSDRREGRPMKLWERIKQSLGAAGEAEVPGDGAGGATEGAGTPVTATEVAAVIAAQMSQGKGGSTAPDPKIAALEAQVASLHAQRIQDAGIAFAQETVRSGRALPAEAAGIAVLFCQAATDDAAHPGQVQFGVDAEKKPIVGSRVDALKAHVAARPVNKLVSDSLQGLFNAETTPGLDPVGDAAAEDAKAKAAAEAYAASVNRPGKGN